MTALRPPVRPRRQEHRKSGVSPCNHGCSAVHVDQGSRSPNAPTGGHGGARERFFGARGSQPRPLGGPLRAGCEAGYTEIAGSSRALSWILGSRARRTSRASICIRTLMGVQPDNHARSAVHVDQGRPRGPSSASRLCNRIKSRRILVLSSTEPIPRKGVPRPIFVCASPRHAPRSRLATVSGCSSFHPASGFAGGR